MDSILILGSGPNVLAARSWPRAQFDAIVAINNAHLVRPDWDAAIYPWDFPAERRPVASHDQLLIAEDTFVRAQNVFGGFVYAGATMAFTAAYWALHHYRPRVIGMIGCDMHYPHGQTHFYGTGTPDPLRPDITLQSLEAKATRLRIIAAQQGCAMVNLSEGPSRLTFPRTSPQALRMAVPSGYDGAAAHKAAQRETSLGYYVESGRYWEDLTRFNPAELQALDALWLAADPQTLPRSA